ncbi:uncharacterized protein N7506_002809 [Penicillium brevicompactum]|uniref:uncharacterized protein n=1 Tax=Penicillium brevicompactum TaxID=5074 RepID=UPI002540C177|nr:uncharacterized protein N7506_002809 [Penicillium brevicompactum]KAJ5342985.1 hypothetical protein N7506_002809 [Penicillium brevicompactum]
MFRLTCDTGIRLVLAPKYLDEVRSHPSLSFSRLLQAETHAHIRGFEPFSEDGDLFLEVIRKKLTQAQDWHEVALYPTIQKLVAQMSCKIFLGDELCRNEDWLRVMTSYTGLVIQGAAELQLWPKIVRPVVALLLNSTNTLRNEVQMAREIMKPILAQRAREKEMTVKYGRVPKPNDNALQWMEDIADGRPFDPVVMQLSLATVAIVTTADFLTKALLDICGKDALVSELREEMITVLREDGMEKTSMYKLRLMDSFLKESQRLKPLSLATFRRMAMDDIELNDGSKIAKGTGLMITNDKMWDSKVYEDPETFDPYRFVKLRQVPGYERSASLVSVSPEHMGFGYGTHACPGRFFAVNEAKIALCHILLKYEFKLAEGMIPQFKRHGIVIQTDMSARIMVRRRPEEVSF